MSASASSTGIIFNITTPQSVARFINSLGVATHMASGNSQWSNSTLILQQLNYLGISAVRDGAPFDYALPTFVTLAREGVRFVLAEANVYSFDQNGQVNAAIDVWRARQLETTVPGSVIAFEGTNEYSTNSFNLDGFNSFGNLDWGLRDAAQLREAVRADVLFANVPIIAPSAVQLDSLPDFSPFVDAANAHIYGGVAENLQDRIINSIRYAQASAPGEPVYITEIGISSSGYGTSNWGVTDEDTQAVINVNALLSSFSAGAEMTFLYELMDEPYASNTQEQHFGLFHVDGSPKPVATAIHNLTTILHDDGKGTAPLTGLEYVLSGLPGTASSMLLQHSNGIVDLIIWNGRAVLHDDVSEVAPASAAVTLTLGTSAASLQVFNPIISSTALVSYSNIGTVTVQMSADPIVIQIRPFDSGNGVSLVQAPVTDNVVWLSKSVAQITGSGEAGNTISIMEGGLVLGTTLIDASGHWSVRLPSSPAARHELSLVAVTPTGIAVPAAGVTLYGKAKQELIGGSGDDILIGASGSRMIGGAGDDHFVFNAGSGKGVIADFQHGFGDTIGDEIHISRTLAVDYDWLMAHARQSGSNVVISFNRTEILTLENVNLFSLHPDNFLFF